ncbi:hypothetical protein THMIRHAM_07680 [Thiomicrorhabdus immobilis]|uniref:Uncharacterized protein n=2 Tax=Thiomicrorhabdus immobilis TaxID=2791037 RepID=A0ABM7MCA8_9GAMM|nr:hypothetical protein THMIRHAM_07680 [Thiomicrorhabdus immobilis]
MLLSAQRADWQRFSELDSEWLKMLETAVNKYGQQVEDISLELLADNVQIQELIEKEQRLILRNLQNDTKNMVSVKTYLK